MNERYLVDGKVVTIYTVQSPRGKQTYFKGYWFENGTRHNCSFGKVDPRPSLQRVERQWTYNAVRDASSRYRVQAYARTLEQLHDLAEYHDLPMVKALAMVVAEAHKKLPPKEQAS